MCRSRRELSNEYLLSTVGFDTAENEPCKVCPLSAYRSHYYYYYYGSPRSANAVFEKLETDLTKSGSTSGTCVIGNLCLGQFVVNINLGDCRSAYVADSGRRAERSC